MEVLLRGGWRGLFDLGLAHELYNALIGPVEPLIRDKRHLMVVPSGALTALPFHLLVTEKPVVAVPQVKAARDLGAYRDAQWLLKRHAVSVLPSVASLKVLRVFAHEKQGAKPLVGFGDPIFNPEGENRPDAQEKIVVATRSYPEFWKGVDIDRGMLRALPPLPETADELKAVAAKLGASMSDIHLQKDASESTVKRAALADYRVVYFATHGLVAGDVKGLGEPALALTIPSEPSELDDGLLTASEVAQLKLNADWVVLSACNTAAGKTGCRSAIGAGARLLLRGCSCCVTLGGGEQSRDDPHHLDFRHSQVRSHAWPRRGAAPRHARLHERHHGPAERLSGDLGAVRCGRRRGGEVSGAVAPRSCAPRQNRSQPRSRDPLIE